MYCLREWIRCVTNIITPCESRDRAISFAAGEQWSSDEMWMRYHAACRSLARYYFAKYRAIEVDIECYNQRGVSTRLLAQVPSSRGKLTP